jgi:hypothetical protein
MIKLRMEIIIKEGTAAENNLVHLSVGNKRQLVRYTRMNTIIDTNVPYVAPANLP